jgi:hypothetical protein
VGISGNDCRWRGRHAKAFADARHSQLSRGMGWIGRIENSLPVLACAGEMEPFAATCNPSPSGVGAGFKTRTYGGRCRDPGVLAGHAGPLHLMILAAMTRIFATVGADLRSAHGGGAKRAFSGRRRARGAGVGRPVVGPYIPARPGPMGGEVQMRLPSPDMGWVGRIQTSLPRLPHRGRSGMTPASVPLAPAPADHDRPPRP